VLIRGARLRDWPRYATRAEAEAAARKLRAHGFDATVVADDELEHCSDRRRFLVWAVMAGFAQPERITARCTDPLAERVVAL
jgi:hypothetical protein